MTFAPSRANLRAVAWPIPRPAPVMMLILPASLMRLALCFRGLLDGRDSSRICGIAQWARRRERRPGSGVCAAARKERPQPLPAFLREHTSVYVRMVVESRLRKQIDYAPG